VRAGLDDGDHGDDDDDDDDDDHDDDDDDDDDDNDDAPPPCRFTGPSRAWFPRLACRTSALSLKPNE
jgi:hypothetical protein